MKGCRRGADPNRARLLKAMRERPGLGDTSLFPSPRNLNVPQTEQCLQDRHHKAQELAKLPRSNHASFRGLRPKWATERKHLSDVDVAEAGDWRSVNTMKRSYQKADDAGVLEAVLEPRKLAAASAPTFPF